MSSRRVPGTEVSPLTKPLAFVAITGLLSFGWVASSPDDAFAAACTSGLTSPTGYAGGSGTQGDPWQISNQAELVLLSESDADHASYFEQTADITLDLSGCDWIPIGNLDTSGDDGTGGDQFQGEYDGGNHSITGFNTTNLSLFHTIEGVDSSTPAVVKNLRVVDAVAESFQLRGILAEDITDAQVDNVHVSGQITVDGSNKVGGFAEKVNGNSVVSNSSSDLEISSDDPNSYRQQIGGIAAELDDSAKILSSWTTGSFTQVKDVTGGLVGDAKDADTLISRSWSSVSITASEEYIGGLVGEAGGEIRFSYATGNLNVAGDDRTGGLVGYLNHSLSDFGKISDSYALGQVAVTGGTGRAGGLIGVLRKFDNVVERSFSTQAPQVADDTNTGAFAGSNGGITDSDFNTLSPPLADLTNLSANFFDNSSSGDLPAVANTTNEDAAGALTRVRGLPTSQLNTFSTFDSAGWAIVDGWAAFDAPDTGTVDPNTHKVWGICSGVNDGYPFLLWQYDSNPCTATAAESSGRSMDERVEDAGIHLDVQGVVAEQVAGSPVVIGGQGLAAGSAYTLVLRSTPQVIESGVANAAGNFSKEVVMPAGIAPGAHSVTLTAIGADGSTLSLVTSFVVSPSGVFSSVSPNVATATAGLAATGPADELWLWGSGFIALLLAGVVLTIARGRTRTTQSL